MGHHYTLRLTDGELRSLAWAVNRGYWPEEAYDALETDDEGDGPEPAGGRLYRLPEHAAWSILEDCTEEGYLTCIGGELLDKLLALEGEIV